MDTAASWKTSSSPSIDGIRSLPAEDDENIAFNADLEIELILILSSVFASGDGSWLSGVANPTVSSRLPSGSRVRSRSLESLPFDSVKYDDSGESVGNWSPEFPSLAASFGSLSPPSSGSWFPFAVKGQQGQIQFQCQELLPWL